MAGPESQAIQNVRATIDATTLPDDVRDVVVIGAGPAGAMAARQLSLQGTNVLLIDRAAFPRPKVCGCCLNGAALQVLSQVGLGELPAACQARPLTDIRLASGGCFAALRLLDGVSLSRDRFDAALIRAAIEAGADFLDQTSALVGESHANNREVILKTATGERTIRAKAIVLAGGLGCRVFAGPQVDDRHTSESSRVGAGTILDVPLAQYAGGTIFMACHRHGYVGLVRLEDDRLDVAAALDAAAIKQHGSMAELVTRILADAGLPIPDGLSTATWHGTARLTQRRKQVAHDRCFFIGDAAGYVEPFTGEGMAWALASGRSVAPIVTEFVNDGCQTEADQAWSQTHRRLILKRARMCRAVSQCLRYPRVVHMAVRILAIAPSLAVPVMRSLNASFQAGP